MNRFSRYFKSISCVIAFALVFSVSADAQLLNKLSKGLEKVKKTVEQVDKTLNSQKPKKQKESGSNQSARQNKVDHSALNADYAADAEEEENEDLLESMVKGVGAPFITPDTKYLQIPNYSNVTTLTNAHDGVFGVSMHKGVLDNHIYGFWTVDGKKLFDAEWEDLTYQNNMPEFHDGVVAMRKAGSTVMSRQPIYLLYSDGRSKKLPGSENWFSVTNFMDGLAIAHGPIGEGKCFYINTSGEKVFPHIVMNGMPLGGIRPLRDGLRAFCIGTDKWGYIDEKGVIKFPAKFQEAGNFSEGYAWVVTEDNVKQLIDKTGKSVFKLDNRNANTSEVVNGIFYVSVPYESSMDYYDVSGNKLMTVDAGNQFYDGYAFVYIPQHQIDLSTPIAIIDKDMNVVRSIPLEIMDWSEASEHKPVFNSKGFATVNSGLIYQGSSVIRPNGDIVLRRYNPSDRESGCTDFSPVSDDGYIKANITYISNNPVKGAAIMRTNGEIVCVVSDNKSGNGPLTENGIEFPTQNFPANNAPVYLKEI